MFSAMNSSLMTLDGGVETDSEICKMGVLEPTGSIYFENKRGDIATLDWVKKDSEIWENIHRLEDFQANFTIHQSWQGGDEHGYDLTFTFNTDLLVSGYKYKVYARWGNSASNYTYELMTEMKNSKSKRMQFITKKSRFSAIVMKEVEQKVTPLPFE